MVEELISLLSVGVGDKASVVDEVELNEDWSDVIAEDVIDEKDGGELVTV